MADMIVCFLQELQQIHNIPLIIRRVRDEATNHYKPRMKFPLSKCKEQELAQGGSERHSRFQLRSASSLGGFKTSYGPICIMGTILAYGCCAGDTPFIPALCSLTGILREDDNQQWELTQDFQICKDVGKVYGSSKQPVWNPAERVCERSSKGAGRRDYKALLVSSQEAAILSSPLPSPQLGHV